MEAVIPDILLQKGRTNPHTNGGQRAPRYLIYNRYGAAARCEDNLPVGSETFPRGVTSAAKRRYDDKDGQRQYEWGHYGSDRAALEQDFTARVQEYQRLYNVDVRQVEAPGLYKYYSTQCPVDIGTFPKPPRNAPDEIVNYDQRVPVENGAFMAWGHLTYTRPLTKRQASDYELRPSPNNPDRPRSIREQMKTAAKQAEADRGQSAPKKNAPDRGDR